MPKAEEFHPNCADLILATAEGKKLKEESQVKLALRDAVRMIDAHHDHEDKTITSRAMVTQ